MCLTVPCHVAMLVALPLHEYTHRRQFVWSHKFNQNVQLTACGQDKVHAPHRAQPYCYVYNLAPASGGLKCQGTL